AQGTPRKKARWPLVLSGVAAFSAELLHFTELAPESVVAGVALLAILLCGLTTYKKGWIALKNGNLNINALMSIAVTGAVLIGEWPEAAMVNQHRTGNLNTHQCIDVQINVLKGDP